MRKPTKLRVAGAAAALSAAAYAVYEYLTCPEVLEDIQLDILMSSLLNGQVHWRPADGCLYIIDVFDQVVWRQRVGADGQAEGQVERVVSFDGQVNPTGVCFRPDGAMLVLLGAARKLVAVRPGAEPEEPPELVLDFSEQEPAPVMGMCMDADGGIYVTCWGCYMETYIYDPMNVRRGRVAYVPPPGRSPASGGGLLPTGAADLECTTDSVVTPDGRTCIAVDTFGCKLWAWDRDEATGMLSKRRVWADLYGVRPSSLCLDEEGCAWVGVAGVSVKSNCLMGPLSFDLVKTLWTGATGFGGVARVREGGQILEKRLMLSRGVKSIALGGPDGRTLFAVGTQVVLWTAKAYADTADNSLIATFRVAKGAARIEGDPSYWAGKWNH